MRDCMEPKSRPAGPACCLRDCKLSLRMQTDKQDRHHLPILPSNTETVIQAAPLPLPFCFFGHPSLHLQSFLFLYIQLNELPGLFPPSVTVPPILLFPWVAFSVDEMSQLPVYSPLSLLDGSLPLHRR